MTGRSSWGSGVRAAAIGLVAVANASCALFDFAEPQSEERMSDSGTAATDAGSADRSVGDGAAVSADGAPPTDAFAESGDGDQGEGAAGDADAGPAPPLDGGDDRDAAGERDAGTDHPFGADALAESSADVSGSFDASSSLDVGSGIDSGSVFDSDAGAGLDASSGLDAPSDTGSSSAPDAGNAPDAGDCRTLPAGNLVLNGGFDRDISGWWSDINVPFFLSWSSRDALECADSGSVLASNEAPDGLNTSFTRCLGAVEPGQAYDVGGSVWIPSGGAMGQTFILLDWFTGPNCTGTVLTDGSGLLLQANDFYDQWQTLSRSGLVVPPNVQSAQFEGKVIKNLPNSLPYQTYFDRLYVAPSP